MSITCDSMNDGYFTSSKQSTCDPNQIWFEQLAIEHFFDKFRLSLGAGQGRPDEEMMKSQLIIVISDSEHKKRRRNCENHNFIEPMPWMSLNWHQTVFDKWHKKLSQPPIQPTSKPASERVKHHHRWHLTIVAIVHAEAAAASESAAVAFIVH